MQLRWLAILAAVVAIGLLSLVAMNSRAARLGVEGLSARIDLSLNRDTHNRVTLMATLTDVWTYEIAPGICAEKRVQTTQNEGESQSAFEDRHAALVKSQLAKYPPKAV